MRVWWLVVREQELVCTRRYFAFEFISRETRRKIGMKGYQLTTAPSMVAVTQAQPPAAAVEAGAGAEVGAGVGAGAGVEAGVVVGAAGAGAAEDGVHM